MDITPTRRKLEEEGLEGGKDGMSGSPSASSDTTLHHSVSSTWTHARFTEGPEPDISHALSAGQSDEPGLTSLDPNKEPQSHQVPRPPLPSLTTERPFPIIRPPQAAGDSSDHESLDKGSPQPGLAAPNSSPCPTSYLTMPDITLHDNQPQPEPKDGRPRESLAGTNTGSSLISPASQLSTRTPLPAYLVSDHHDAENTTQDEPFRAFSQLTHVSRWTPPSSPSFPDSDSESLSSFPSVTSSMCFFSSAGASPHISPVPDVHPTNEESRNGAPTRRRSRQTLQPLAGGISRTSSRAHSRSRGSSTRKIGHISQSSLENLPHTQKPIPFPDRKGGTYNRSSATTSARKEPALDLAIPTLSLPTALPQPTQFGQNLGRIRVVLLADPPTAKSDLSPEDVIEKLMQTLIWDNEDIIDAGDWEQIEGGSLGGIKLQSLLASTDWSQPKSTNSPQPSFYSDEGSEKFKGNENVEIVRVTGISASASLGNLTGRLKRLLIEPFQRLSSLLLPSLSLSLENKDNDDTFDLTSALAKLLASSDATPLFTALVAVVGPAGPSEMLKPLLRELSSFVPIILLPSHSSSRSRRNQSFSSAVPKAKLSTFTPTSTQALLGGLFRAPETLKKIRMEAVERFLKWREVEGEVARLLAATSKIPLISSNLNDSTSSETQHPLEVVQAASGRRFGLGVRMGKGKPQPQWQEWKQQWETEWMESFSVDVASRLREERGNQPTPTHLRFKPTVIRRRVGSNESQNSIQYRSGTEDDVNDHSPLILSPLAQSTTMPSDPLHLPSLIILSFSLLGPLKQKLTERIKNMFTIFYDTPLHGHEEEAHSQSCNNCGYVVSSASKRDHPSGNHVNRRLVMVGLGGLVIGVGIGLCAK